MTQKFFPAFVKNYGGRGTLFLLVSFMASSAKEIPVDLGDIEGTNQDVQPAYAQGYSVASDVKKPFNSLQVAGPAAVTGLTSLAALNVKNGADFGSDLAIDGNLYVDGGIVLDSCLVLTCTSAGTLLVNGQPITAGGGGSCNLPAVVTAIGIINDNASTSFANTFTALAALGACMPIPLEVSSTGTVITNPGYYCLANDVTLLGGTIQIGNGTVTVSDVTLDLNNHTITVGSALDGIDVYSGCSSITIKNGNISMPDGQVGINLGGLSSDSDFYIYDVTIDSGAVGISAPNGLTNLDIARVIVTNPTLNGFNINGASNVILSACQASGTTLLIGGGGGFYIVGASGSSALLDSCIAVSNSNNGFYIAGQNVTLINCVAQANGFGFALDASAVNTMLENCTANFNTTTGFYNGTTTGPSSFISCAAQDNTSVGFDLSASAGSGLIKSCLAQGNNFHGSPIPHTGCGFYDRLSTHYQYVTNAAEGNGATPGVATGDTNYCITPDFHSTTTLIAPFYQSLVNDSASTGIFAPTYWNNITLK